VRKKCGEEPELSATLQPCTSMDTIRLTKYQGSSIGEFLVKLSLCYYSFVVSSSVLVADTLVEGP
jgi:hypothetical protein